MPIVADAADNGAVEAAVDAVTKEHGRLDHIVANAGVSGHDTLADGDPDQWREMV
ncbi:SDR family NAD(P)-dependent oxidoreductase [Actinomadura sp. HBU206391]|uniref:SDR family NAD(P)-dependent oxidoreductase n=1 Tax=Actinomadura sp. HBU206391 TaxID=2731692 RepID=UPI001C9BDF87|nr:SDR family NAD(P)-dependent oxidoreductase [Actinomadura sp. HBU206391]